MLALHPRQLDKGRYQPSNRCSLDQVTDLKAAGFRYSMVEMDIAPPDLYKSIIPASKLLLKRRAKVNVERRKSLVSTIAPKIARVIRKEHGSHFGTFWNSHFDLELRAFFLLK